MQTTPWQDSMVLQGELDLLKESLYKKYEAHIFKNEINLFEALIPFVKPHTQNLLKKLSETYRYKGIMAQFKKKPSEPKTK